MTNIIPKVSKRSLILIAGLVWCIAGYNILAIGFSNLIMSWNVTIVHIVVSIVIFLLFFKFVFYRMVGKHTRRIKNYQDEKIIVFKFFDTKSYMIMAFMITFGILLRNSKLLPPLCLGTFYVGLGSALAGAGITFLVHYISDEY